MQNERRTQQRYKKEEVMTKKPAASKCSANYRLLTVLNRTRMIICSMMKEPTLNRAIFITVM